MENTSQPTTNNTDFFLTLGMAFLLSTGFTLLVFSLAYAKDLQTLRTVPGAIWSAICGRPVDDGLTLPLMFTLSTVAIIWSGALYGYKRLR